MARHIMAVRSNPVAGRDAEYNEWYDQEQVPALLMTPTLLAAQRYKLADVDLPSDRGYAQPQHRYMVVYEIETDDIRKTRDLIWSKENIARIRPSDAFDAASVDCQFFTPIGSRVLRR